jgi:hypothetical protein
MLAEDDGSLSPRVRQLMSELRAEWRELDAKIEAFNASLSN